MAAAALPVVSCASLPGVIVHCFLSSLLSVLLNLDEMLFFLLAYQLLCGCGKQWQYNLTALGHSYCHSQEFGSVVGAAESASSAVHFSPPNVPCCRQLNAPSILAIVVVIVTVSKSYRAYFVT